VTWQRIGDAMRQPFIPSLSGHPSVGIMHSSVVSLLDRWRRARQ